MNRHRKKQCDVGKICHCLIVEKRVFYVCCGYWCQKCRGRIVSPPMPQSV